jgi:hypothetical protein
VKTPLAIDTFPVDFWRDFSCRFSVRLPWGGNNTGNAQGSGQGPPEKERDQQVVGGLRMYDYIQSQAFTPVLFINALS